MEIWKPVVGYEGLYEVSNQGNVRSLDRTVKAKDNSTRILKGKILKQALHTSGYDKFVNLCKNSKSKSRLVSHLVVEAFIGPRPEGLVVLHGKRGRLVNTLENLSYGTSSKNNLEDKLRDGTDNRGEKNGRAKLTKDQVIRIKINREKWTTYNWAKEFNISLQTIYDIKAGRRWAWLKP